MSAQLYPDLEPALRSVYETAGAGRPTRLGPAKLRALRAAGLAYTVKRPDGRYNAHLTKRGRQELGVDVGIAR